MHKSSLTSIILLKNTRKLIRRETISTIYLKQFDNISTFITNTVKNTISLNVTKKDLISCAIFSGGFSHTTLTPTGENFYSSLIEITLDDGRNFIIREDYNNSEQSIKTSLSFF